jgi:putative DNA primase/helicase
MPDPEWLIDGILPANKLSVVYGASGTGKSFLALDWGLSIATGTGWQGNRVKQGGVAYIAAEKGPGYKHRIQAWFQHTGFKQAEDLPFILVNGSVSLEEIAAF